MSLDVANLTVTLGGARILSNVTLDVERAERMAVMGPSGAGKSTLLRTVAGLVRPDSGTVHVGGEPMGSTPPHRRPIGLMFQDYALFPHLDVRSNVAYGLRMHGISRHEALASADELLELVGMSSHRSRFPASLSGGEQQRVALARTLAPRPAIVLFDEPLGSLDQELKEDLLDGMRQIVDELGVTSVYVTHDRAEAIAFGHRICIMRDGSTVRTDTPEALWSDPRTEFVARFVGHRAILRGDLVGLGPGLVAVPVDAVRVDNSSPIRAVVASSVFDAGRYRLSMTLGDSVIEAIDTRPRSTGSAIGLAIEGDAAIRLSDG